MAKKAYNPRYCVETLEMDAGLIDYKYADTKAEAKAYLHKLIRGKKKLNCKEAECAEYTEQRNVYWYRIADHNLPEWDDNTIYETSYYI